MGTRNLTIVYLDGAYKLAQYGQWDGYPDGQGATILKFLKTGVHKDPAFLDKVRNLKWLSDADIETMCAPYPDDWNKKYPHLSRDTGGKILQMIADNPSGLALSPHKSMDLDFAGESLMCEWAYVVDLDTGTFEIYKGFNKEPLADGERFAHLQASDTDFGGYKYYQVKLKHSWPLDALPEEEGFVSILMDSDEEEK